jgi:hypothetical protein
LTFTVPSHVAFSVGLADHRALSYRNYPNVNPASSSPLSVRPPLDGESSLIVRQQPMTRCVAIFAFSSLLIPVMRVAPAALATMH